MTHTLPSGSAPENTEAALDDTEPYPEDDELVAKKGPKVTFSTKRGWGSRVRGWMSHWTTFAPLTIAVLAAALAAVAWIRPFDHSSSAGFNSQQTGVAKKSVCAAYGVVHQAVVANTHLANPVPDDPVGTLAVAANARLALLGGGSYLRERLAGEPATPADLAKAVNSMTDTLEELGINYLAGASYIVQDPLRGALDSEISDIDKMCQ